MALEVLFFLVLLCIERAMKLRLSKTSLKQRAGLRPMAFQATRNSGLEPKNQAPGATGHSRVRVRVSGQQPNGESQVTQVHWDRASRSDNLPLTRYYLVTRLATRQGSDPDRGTCHCVLGVALALPVCAAHPAHWAVCDLLS